MTRQGDDPFAHLHDEDYMAAYAAPRADHRTMVFMGGRKRHSLNGAWRFTLDLFDLGLRHRWFADEPGPPEAWPRPRDYDAGMGEEIEVPSCWTAVRPEWRHFEGGAWYTRMIDGADLDRSGRTVLRIGAAAQAARVFLNGRFLAAHSGGSTPFFVELTEALRDGANRLQINVDNRRDVRRVPALHIDWFNHGGIHRDVDILTLPRVFIADAGVALAPGSNGTRDRHRRDPVRSGRRHRHRRGAGARPVGDGAQSMPAAGPRRSRQRRACGRRTTLTSTTSPSPSVRTPSPTVSASAKSLSKASVSF